MTPAPNTGDGHQMAMAVGAKLGSMNTFFGYGVVYEPWDKGRDGKPVPQMMMGLGPGSIIVNPHGNRFMHGGYTYNDFPHPVRLLRPAQPGLHQPASGLGHLRRRRPRAGHHRVQAGHRDELDRPRRRGSARLAQLAGSIRELAEQIGIDPDALEATVERYNTYAEKGEDPDWGDPGQTSRADRAGHGEPQADHRPALRRHPAVAGHPRHQRRAAHRQGRAGARQPECRSSTASTRRATPPPRCLGSIYPGGGSCIGPSVTMGYRAGRHLAEQAVAGHRERWRASD